MKICSSIISFAKKPFVNSKSNNDSKVYGSNNLALSSYPSNYYLNFCGGNSLQLDKTYEKIKEFNAFPPNIQEEVEEILENNNPDDLKLVDIHKTNYKDVLECDNLEELKFFYPEFEEVLSVDDVPYQKNSFIDKFKKGQFVDKNGQYILNPNKELSLQLIKMYYADCLSTVDLGELFGVSPYSVMKKLNIPTLNSVYGQYLKLSDVDKNKAISEAISRNNQEKKVSQVTRDKISSSLKRYYEENPDVVFNRNQNHSGAFKDAEKSAVFSEVLIRAWDYNDSKAVKKALSRYMKKKELSSKEFVELTTSTQPNVLKEFWNRNPWAKQKFSVSMEKSWKRQKELEKLGLITEPKSMVRYVPIQLRDEFIKANPELGALAFEREFYCVYDREPKFHKNAKDFKDKTEQIFKDVLINNKKNYDRWDTALAHACMRFYADAVKSVPDEVIAELSQIIYNYVTNVEYSTYGMLKDLISTSGTHNRHKEIISLYLDDAWDKVESDMESIDLANQKILQGVRKYLTQEQNENIDAISLSKLLYNIVTESNK